MGEGEAEGDVGIALPGDVRDPVAVADDRGVVFGGGLDGGGARRTRPGVFDAPQRSSRSLRPETAIDREDAAQDHDPGRPRLRPELIGPRPGWARLGLVSRVGLGSDGLHSLTRGERRPAKPYIANVSKFCCKARKTLAES